jgi:hypothetical protein
MLKPARTGTSGAEFDRRTSQEVEDTLPGAKIVHHSTLLVWMSKRRVCTDARCAQRVTLPKARLLWCAPNQKRDGSGRRFPVCDEA